MTSTRFSIEDYHDNKIVISFFQLLQLYLKSPNSKRIIDWNMKFFLRNLEQIDTSSPLYGVASRMAEELTLCQHRRRSRFRMYNVSNIDEVYNHYWIHQSPRTLGDAWSLFETGRYRTEV